MTRRYATEFEKDRATAEQTPSRLAAYQAPANPPRETENLPPTPDHENMSGASDLSAESDSEQMQNEWDTVKATLALTEEVAIGAEWNLSVAEFVVAELKIHQQEKEDVCNLPIA